MRSLLTFFPLLLCACSGPDSRIEAAALESTAVLSAPLPGTSVTDTAYSARILRLSYPEGATYASVLLVLYGDAAGASITDITGATRPAGDLFVTRSTDEGLTWSEPVDVSRTATLASIAVDLDGDPATPASPYPGDSRHPVLLANGPDVLVVWSDTYAPGGFQKTEFSEDSPPRELPFCCIYAARSLDGGASWSEPERLTDARRDAYLVTGAANKNGFALVWQEDPAGLQLGEAEGPGEGDSGAKTSWGTDLWFTAVALQDFENGALFPAPRRVTDNFTTTDESGRESGAGAASRPNLALSGKTALLVYEERARGASGKTIRYHVFSAFDDSAPDPTAGAGWTVSDPAENARRARIVVQDKPGETSGAKLLLLWRQGTFPQGGPADVLARVGRVRTGVAGSTGYGLADLEPPVSPDTPEHNAPAINLSSLAGLQAATGDDPIENARAHRAILRGDLIAAGFTRTPDAAASDQGLASYDLFLRISRDGGATWEAPLNLSRLEDPALQVAEPRLVPTQSSADPAVVRDDDVFYAAWSVLDVRTGESDLFYTSTTDSGRTFAPVLVLADGPGSQREAQIRVSPDGRSFDAVWADQTPNASEGDAVESTARFARKQTGRP